ncbi:hypothetical protein D7X55_13400 [Corallococcus sp. AB049A]|uniref:Uncharacterized protein n=2 Tax=Myxococcaceae TaxID=31 RepID=A0A3A8Q177_9BACT|nr:hypothetical protein D7Y23_21290 [Corallococcus sp. AB050B]RKH62517.1 hypothetical protein D7X96_29605 [Corallococcus interemptor]RKI67591.1 hypothetical protein D7X55_13400 [Corallococcus sp. AB049A]
MLPGLALAQAGGTGVYPAPQPPPPPAPGMYPAPSSQAEEPTPAQPSSDAYAQPPPTQAAPQANPDETPRPASDAPLAPPDPDRLRTEPQAPLTEGAREVRPESIRDETATAASRIRPPPEDNGVFLDGQRRRGPFLSGPGSMRFVLHHTALGALGGFFTQAFSKEFNFDRSSRESMLAGTLIGAGLGFGASAWWQFNNWVDTPMANFTILNSGIGGMALAGFMDLITQDPGVLTWSAFLGAELAAWLTAGIGGGQLPLSDGLLVASGAGWAAAYSALFLAIVHFSGTSISGKTWKDMLLISPGVGAGILALATMRYNPTASQILRADLFGGGVGAAVLLISGLVLGGFNQSTPYVLSFLGSAGAITTVSLLWEESVDRSALRSSRGAKDRPYKNVWW